MAENKTFTLIGKFDDQITPSLKKLNRTFAAFEKVINRGMGRSFRELNKDLRDFTKDLDKIGDIFDRKATRGVNKFRDGIKAAGEDARVLGKNLGDASKIGDGFGAGMKDGIRAAQSEAKVLGDILKANALIKVGEGVAGAGAAGFRGGMRGVGMIYQFIAKRAKEAAQDQLQDIQARGSLFGALNKAELFSNAKNIKDQKQLADINEKNYDTTRSISRAMESSIADVVKSSTVSTATITTLSRQLSDNLLPSLLKAEGVTDLSKFEGPEGRKQLDALMGGKGGKKGVGKELATLYEQMGSIITSPQFAPQAAMGFTQYLGQGTINRQLSIFENNPVLVDAMRKYAVEFGNTTEGRIKALKKALEVAMPEAALQEARTTLMGGIQSISDTLTNATAGILSMGADIAGQGQKTLAMARANGSFDLQVKAFERRQNEARMTWLAEGTKNDKELADRKKMEAEQLQKFTRGLTRLYENADSPIEVIAASFGPLMQKLADILGSIGNVFIGPVMAIMDKLQPALARLMDNIEAIGSNIRAGKPIGQQLGRLIGEFFKAFATLFTPGSVAEQGGSAIQKFFRDFAEGFKQVNGQKYLDIIMNGINNFLMNVIFNEGNVTKGLTPLGDGLLKIFALLSAPAFVNALIAGLVPLAITGMGSMLLTVFKGLGKGLLVKTATSAATPAAAAAVPWAAGLTGATAGAAGAGGAGAAAGGGALAALALPAAIAAAAAAVIIFQGPLLDFAAWLTNTGAFLTKSKSLLDQGVGQITIAIGQLISGITSIFGGLWDILVGMWTGDQKKIIGGFKRIGAGLWNLVQAIINAVVGSVRFVFGFQEKIRSAINTLFLAIWNAITGQKVPAKPGGASTKGQLMGSTKPTKGGKGSQLTGEGWPLSHYSTKNWGEGCSVGSLGGSQAGGVDAFNSVARGKGLSLTSGYRPGSKGFHGINRARDYSNGYSPTPQMLSFATHMAQTYGANLRELIYTPLGFSIKNGRKVPPYATEGHYNHVHVAYALGAGMPAFFSSQRDARAWENKATLGNVKVSSITSNSSEGMGGGVTVHAPITIHQQPGQNAEQLASIVAMELANAVRQARSSSMYV